MELHETEKYYESSKAHKYGIFEQYLLEQIALEFDVSKGTNSSFVIETNKYGIVDYFPTKDRLRIRKTNEWRNQGLRLISSIKD